MKFNRSFADVSQQRDRIHWAVFVPDHLIDFLKLIITGLNIWLLRISNGRLGNSFLGTPVLLFYSIGCKTGVERVTPLFYCQQDEKILLVGSNGGNDRHPAWINNINANPEAVVNIKGTAIKMQARIAKAEEYEHYWPLVKQVFSFWERFQDKTDRAFPIVVLEPR